MNFSSSRKNKKMDFAKHDRKASSDSESVSSQHDSLSRSPFNYLKLNKIEIKETLENGLKYIRIVGSGCNQGF